MEADPKEMQELSITERQATEASNEEPVESSIPTPSFTPQPETTEHSPSSEVVDEVTSTSTSGAASEQTTEPSSPSTRSQSKPAQDKATPPPPPPPPIKRRPRRTGQPLHLLLQDCSRQTPEEINAIVIDKKALAADLQVYSNEFVITSARDRVIGEVDEQGKELLKDVSPESEVIKKRFEDESSVFKSYEDAMHDIRVDLHLDSLKPRKENEETPEALARNAELNAVLQIWDTHHKRIDIEPRRAGRSTQGPYPTRGGRPVGPPSTRGPYPYPSSRGPPPYGAPYPPPRAHHRDYNDRPPYREDYYSDRRDDYRRSDFDRIDHRDHAMGMRAPGPGPINRPDMRDPRDFRDRPPPARGDHPYAAGARFEDRRRDRPEGAHVPPPRDSRHGGAPSGGLPGHPSLPPKPHVSSFDNNAASHGHPQAANGVYSQHSHHHQQQHQQSQYPSAIPSVDPTAPHAAYYAQQQQQHQQQHPQPQAYPGTMPGQVDYAGYGYGAYAQDPAATAAYYGAQGWDMNGTVAATAAAAAAAIAATAASGSLQTAPFSSNQPGRHKAVPLPTDFMSGPSDAPRLSMPEPHQVLGSIRGVIIRDAHGNIGLSQYQFTQAK
ncbi:hypothetical protein BGZ94_003584 [Podila epigama]|nr:hypothetical protein BGZ94_003584 [Podila epigama]